jgi:hypothetical protein
MKTDVYFYLSWYTEVVVLNPDSNPVVISGNPDELVINPDSNPVLIQL